MSSPDKIPDIPADLDPAYMRRLAGLYRELGISPAYCRQPLFQEPAELAEAGPDFYGRPQLLMPAAGEAWRRMQAAAAEEGIVLHLVSAFRSVDYQCGLIRRKLDRGVPIEQILTVNAAPGLSEHHTGRAVDVCTDDSPPLEEAFEDTPAFAWLVRHAARFGFRLSYPRGNTTGICYEPWHWCYEGDNPL